MRARLITCALALALAACAPPHSFRDPATPISSTTRFDLARFAGDWQVVARFAQAGDPAAAAPETLRIGPDGAVQRAREVCADGACAMREERQMLAVTGPGRFTLAGAEHWVLWVDADFRTAAIGTPSGAFGWVMERGGAPTPPDRMAAARDILDWAGYDLTRLVRANARQGTEDTR